MKATTLRGPRGYTLTLDPSEVNLDNPGEGTPALVHAPFGRGSATFDCALDTGEVSGPRNDIQLPPDVLRWLDSYEVATKLHTVLPDCYPEPCVPDRPGFIHND